MKLPALLARRIGAVQNGVVIWLAVGLAAAGLILAPGWQSIESKVFDKLSVLTAPGRSMLPITLVGIDEASFTQVGERWPWPRSIFARVIDRLAAQGAAVIVIDVVFYEPSTPEQDEALAAAIARAGNVVLAADHAYQETALVRQWLRIDPIPLFTQAGAQSGLATMTLDNDAIVRRLPQARDAFWRRTIETLLRTRPGITDPPQASGELFIRHLGPAHTFPYVSLYQVLSGDSTLPSDLFKDQIVFVGRDVRSSAEVGLAQADLFATPFLDGTGRLTPGFEIIATMVENVLMGQAIASAGNAASFCLLSLAMLLALPAVIRWHPLWSGAWIGGVIGLAAAAAYWLFAKENLWIAAGATIVALLTLYVAHGLYSYLVERQRGAQITRAFEKYVSPVVVRQMVARPELLRLGGERCELTVLFSDLVGFTAMSEKLPPETVSRVMNLYLTEMTQVVMAEGGTVDKFIGDAVMAFWGAPLPDPQHALHGVRAAIAMQQALDRLRPRLAELGVLDLGMRIGVNSGPAVVGNMGSEERFDYTAMGDTVNLAARLEGVNKLYGTKILLSAATAALLPEEVKLREVDFVRVKGKREAVALYTPCEDVTLADLMRNALTAYRLRDWEGARTAFTQAHARGAGDRVASVLLQRILTLETASLPKDWDGAIELEKL